MDFIRRGISWLLLERPVSDKSVTDMTNDLAQSGSKVQERITQTRQTQANHNVITHIIGIERWAQERLKAAQTPAEAPPRDEYDPYRPAKDTPWDELPVLFADTRDMTIQLVQQLDQTAFERDVPHNQLGALSVRAWIQYLRVHADLESRKI